MFAESLPLPLVLPCFPIHLTGMYRCEETAKILLLRSDVNTDRADESGRTALPWTVIYEREGTVGMLLERGVNPGAADEDGGTPLSLD